MRWFRFVDICCSCKNVAGIFCFLFCFKLDSKLVENCCILFRWNKRKIGSIHFQSTLRLWHCTLTHSRAQVSVRIFTFSHLWREHIMFAAQWSNFLLLLFFFRKILSERTQKQKRHDGSLIRKWQFFYFFPFVCSFVFLILDTATQHLQLDRAIFICVEIRFRSVIIDISDVLRHSFNAILICTTIIHWHCIDVDRW